MPLIGVGVGLNRQRYGQFQNGYSSRVIADGGTIESLECVAAASSLLQSASLLLIPSGYKAGVAYAELPANGNGDLTWSRNSVAYRTQSNGNIGSVAANVPRLSYMYGSCPALLLEPQRTNLALYSQNYGDSSWIALGSTKVSTTQTDPSGGSTAVNVTWASGGSGYLYRNQTGLTIGTTYTITFYVRSDNGSSFRLYADSLNSSSSNFTATSTFQRFTLTYTATTTGGTFGFRADTSNSAANLIIAFAQFEQGSYATTYIPTTTATATRLADSFTRNNIYTNGLISASGGTWYVELRNNVGYTRDTFTVGLFISDTTNITSNNINIRNGGGGAVRLSINKVIAGVSTALYMTTTNTVKLAIKWNGTSADIFENGVKVISATSFTPTIMENLGFNLGQVPNFIQAMALYPTPLSDADCTALTT